MEGKATYELIQIDPPMKPPTTPHHNAEVKAAGLAGALMRGNGFPDDVNTVERVQADDFPAGNVQIAVVGKKIPALIGTQKYALVVQGKFSGLLASKYNPAADAAVAAASGGGGGDACVLTVPVIDRAASPGAVTKDPAVSVRFGTKGGVAPVAGFQCKLSGAPPAGAGDAAGAAAAVAAQAHDWRACSSPASYKLPDGVYSFQAGGVAEDGVERVQSDQRLLFCVCWGFGANAEGC
jgi:hypothetical protein